MIISAIAAIGKNRVIGINNQLPWHLPREFNHFKTKTFGHTVITGRKSFEIIGRPLPSRPTIILTRNPGYQRSDCTVVNDFLEALNLAKSRGEEEVFTIGGSEVYRLSLPYLHRFYRTIVDFDQPGDVYFPEYNHYEWKVTDSFSIKVTDNNPLSWNYELLEKTPDIELPT